MDLTQILPGLGSTAFTLLAFIIALSVIVAIHEYGHYIVGRWSGIHAEVFSLGFGPVLWSRVDKRGTKWQFAALPFGGYVKFLGDANAASVGSVEGAPAGQNTMSGAPLWARAATVAAGPIFNFILAVAIFTGYLMWEGKPRDPVTFDRAYDLPAVFASQLQRGDSILTIGGIPLGQAANESSSVGQLDVTPRVDYAIRRDGQDMIVDGPYPIPPAVRSITPRSASDDVGIRVGDVITAIDGNPIYAFAQIVSAKDAAAGAPLTLDVWRDGEMLQFVLAPRRVDIPNADGDFETDFRIGIGGDLFFQHMSEPLGLWTAFTQGSAELWWRIKTSLTGLWKIITGSISTCNLSGPVGIAQTSGSMAQQGTSSFVLFVGMLSAAVGLLNLFPIPVLDGGHLVFHAYEAVTRRKPSDAALQILMAGGLAILAALMGFALLNDLVLCPKGFMI